MKGRVDTGGRALIAIDLDGNTSAPSQSIEVWIDTGFTGDLVVPRTMFDSLGIEPCGSVDAILADGSQIELPTYACSIERFGKPRDLEVVANNGDFPLLGVGLLMGLELRIDYRSLTLSIVDSNDASTR